jgi:hypothetical protein
MEAEEEELTTQLEWGPQVGHDELVDFLGACKIRLYNMPNCN